LPPVGFNVRWPGALNISAADAYTFTASRLNFADLTVTFDDKPSALGAPIALRAGLTPSRLEGSHRGGEPAIENWWRGLNFADKPIDPQSFPHDLSGLKLTNASLQSLGVILAETFDCLRCHEGPARRPGVERAADPSALPGPVLVGL